MLKTLTEAGRWLWQRRDLLLLSHVLLVGAVFHFSWEALMWALRKINGKPD